MYNLESAIGPKHCIDSISGINEPFLFIDHDIGKALVKDEDMLVVVPNQSISRSFGFASSVIKSRRA
jgi:hypothetical protein